MIHKKPPHYKTAGAVRSSEQWRKILDGMSPEDAAQRIFGDLFCFRGDTTTNQGLVLRENYWDDVEQLGCALVAFASLHNESSAD